MIVQEVEREHGIESRTDVTYKSLLYMCEYPPNTLAGAPVIAKQLFRNYDLSKLHILCCERQVNVLSDVARQSLLECGHTIVPTYRRADLRPRRFFSPIQDSINCLRIPLIMRMARKIIAERRVEALFTIPWRCEFALAAYLLHKETGLPLYVFETDDWRAMNPQLLQGFLTARYHARLMREATQLWVTSPNMGRTYRQRFGVDSEFLFHFVDLERYQQIASEVRPDQDSGEIRIVYTGSINTMFYDTMLPFCKMLNRGLTIAGKRVVMSIYGGGCPKEFLGSNVRFEGLVDSSEIPRVLAAADLAFIGVSFSQNSTIRDLVQTSLYTKTIDYLAAGRPVLVVSPTYSGEVDYFRNVTTVVPELDEVKIKEAIARIYSDEAYSNELREKGIDLVRSRHSIECLERIFLHHFQK